jgi:hypothetical protein
MTTSTLGGISPCIDTASCTQALLTLLNRDRAQFGVAPLTLNGLQSSGSNWCIGSHGHSAHMAATGTASSDQFPADICVPHQSAGENVGVLDSGSEWTDLQRLDAGMMAESPPTPAPGCSGTRACRILNPAYRQVGIGIYRDAAGTTWLTEDFLG